MEFPEQGFYWHVHHADVLIEWCRSYKERKAFILENKADNNIDTRIRLFKPVRGTLPREVVEAGKSYHEAWKAYDEASKTAGKTHDKVWKSYHEASKAYDEAWKVCEKALKNNMPAIEDLHRKECPDCPWDGHSIFPNKPR